MPLFEFKFHPVETATLVGDIMVHCETQGGYINTKV